MKIIQYYCDYFINKLYDYKFQIETCKQVYPFDMRASSDNIIYATRYQGCHVRVFKKFIENLPPEFLGHHFYDFGHGKGRALILASHFGLKKVTGIEFAEDLYQASVTNWESYSRLTKTECECQLLHMDAAQFRVTTQNNIYFFFNPFKDKLMDQVLNNIVSSSPSLTNDLFVFVNPRNHFLYDLFQFDLVREIASTDYNRVIRMYRVTDRSSL